MGSARMVCFPLGQALGQGAFWGGLPLVLRGVFGKLSGLTTFSV